MSPTCPLCDVDILLLEQLQVERDYAQEQARTAIEQRLHDDGYTGAPALLV